MGQDLTGRNICDVLQLVGDGEALKVDESSLTGESLAVSRKSGDQVWLLLLLQNVTYAVL